MMNAYKADRYRLYKACKYQVSTYYKYLGYSLLEMWEKVNTEMWWYDIVMNDYTAYTNKL